MTEWQPATEAEAAMRDALRANDQEQYFRILARTELLLPVSAEAMNGRTPIGWGTWTTGGRTHVLAFTSADTLRACLGENAGGVRRLPYHELAATWPNLDWWLAVNPGLPIEGYLPAWFISQLSRGDVRLPGRTVGSRARVERAEPVAPARATASVPGRAIPPEQGPPERPAVPAAALPTVPAAALPTVPASAVSPPPPPPSSPPARSAAALPTRLPQSAPVGSPASAGSPVSGLGADATDTNGSARPGAGDAGTLPARPVSSAPAAMPARPATDETTRPAPAELARPATDETMPLPAQAVAGDSAPLPTRAVPGESAPPPGRPLPADDALPRRKPAPLPTPEDGRDPVETDAPAVDDRTEPPTPRSDATDAAPAGTAEPSPVSDRDDAPPAPPAVDDRTQPPTPPPDATDAASVPFDAESAVSDVATGAWAASNAGDATPVQSGDAAAASGRSGAAAAAWTEPPERLAGAFEPANDVEEELLAAAGDGSTDSFLSTLLLAKVLLPVAESAAPGALPGDEGFAWRTETLDGEPYVVVFTSPERVVDHLTGPVETVTVKFVQLISKWPDPAWSFAVNPGTPVGAKLPGAQIVALASWAAEVGLRDDAEAEPPAAAQEPAPRSAYEPANEDPERPTMMQKPVAPSQLGYYLDRGYDRVSGFVHRANEVAHLSTPAMLHAALGLGYPGSPFGRTAEETYVLRWPAYRPSLYRIPYGGQNEAAMRAMEGWVIERPPFRGTGYAPAENGDVIAEFKVDSIRLPHGSQLWRIAADGSQTLVAVLDCDIPLWRRVGED
ncbi:SseB protein N-terminal domain-containing protein [Micromonospora pattaloongensis]|uniref:SseB protein N-terminal domain-containing protein n=1 Tax=Micromonospora pattaloongensis TaxID=405436 RepID=A0A1H3SD58_9ACTN|nr:SseB family protein [Micromonospora pattaloongensis]SDZ35844.1 SseB protein N-terminal domain-containing protein [Micromonospora pattaloongensis]